MSPKPANLETQYPSCRLTHVVGLFLARLLTYLVRLKASGRATVPPDIAYMVASADLMVHDLICYLAERQLRDAGYFGEAEVLRATGIHRAVCAPSATTSPTELIARIEATQAKFEQAEALSEHLACLVLCLHCFLNSNERKPTCRVMAMADHAGLLTHHHRLSPDPWPPPIHLPPIPFAA